MQRVASLRKQRALGLTAVARPMFLLLVALSLLAGIAGGLLRLGVSIPATAGARWLDQAALSHAALMVCGFLGTVIAIERAVAVKLRTAFIAPAASGLGGLCLLLGQTAAGAWLFVAASVVFIGVNVEVVVRQRAPHTFLLLASAFAWFAANLLFAIGQDAAPVLGGWFAFLVMTIAAERLEMTRLMRHRPGARASLYAVLAALLLGAGASAAWPVAGGVLYGGALLALALWLGAFDIARRTVHSHGLSQFMAICLLGGYAWLAVSGAAWICMALGQSTRDIALHALGLGFIVSMMMGHAPVILPAVARVKLQFGNFFYLPLAALHLSLLVRLGAGFLAPDWRAAGAIFNALAIALFAATVIGAALAWRIHYGAPRARKSIQWPPS